MADDALAHKTLLIGSNYISVGPTKILVLIMRLDPVSQLDDFGCLNILIVFVVSSVLFV